MAATAVRLRATVALALAGLLVLPALLFLPPAVAAVAAFVIAIAVTLPSSPRCSARGAARTES